MKIKNPFKTLKTHEWVLYLASVSSVVIAFIISKIAFSNSDGSTILTLAASLVGVTALIFVAKGAVIGQILTVAFSLLYSIVSYEFRYYGEMITYLFMTMPIAIAAVVEWVKHPFKDNPNEVQAVKTSGKTILLLFTLASITTAIFYFILKYFNTPHLFFSTLSITTSFMASSLTLVRSPLYGVGYAANDIVLIVLWTLATLENTAYLPFVVCFIVFFCNDIYGYFNWKKILKRQSDVASKKD